MCCLIQFIIVGWKLWNMDQKVVTLNCKKFLKYIINDYMLLL